MHEEHRQARKTLRLVNARGVICRCQNNLYWIISHHKHVCDIFGRISRRFKHNHNETYRNWHQDGGWHALSIAKLATAWPLQFRAKNPRSRAITSQYWPFQLYTAIPWQWILTDPNTWRLFTNLIHTCLQFCSHQNYNKAQERQG